jgi:hypothetical protein
MNDVISWSICIVILLVAVFIAIGDDKDGRGA